MTGINQFQTDQAVFNSTERFVYLDWLRLVAIFFVFFIHCGKIFDYHTSVMFNEVRSPVLTIFREFSLLWIMPFFFLISGASVFLALRSQRTGEFIKSKIQRLLIPLILVGTFVINPVYVYVERMFRGETGSGFIQWYPHYFEGMYGFGGNFAPLGQGTHLWYLEFLFVYSLVLLPLFVRLKGNRPSVLSRISVYFEKPMAFFFLFIPVSAIGAAFEITGLGGIRVMGGWDPITYLLFFSYGYLIFSNRRIQEVILKHGAVYFAIALFLSVLYLDIHFGLNLRIPGITRHDLTTNSVLSSDRFVWAAVQSYRGLLAWFWMIGIIWLGRRFLNYHNRFISYANEAVLPFYVLHHSVIYVVGFLVIQGETTIFNKFSLIAGISFIVIMALYEFLVRRLRVLRFVFGMKN